MAHGEIFRMKHGLLFAIIRVSTLIIYKYVYLRAIKMSIGLFFYAANWYYGPAEPLDPPVCGNSSGAGYVIR